MSRCVVTIRTVADRALVARWAGQVPEGTRFEIKAARRSLDQNALFWAMLSDIARQLPWHGLKLSTADWKLIFLDALKRELRLVPNIDGTGFVNLGTSSSDLTKAEFSDLLEIIFAFGVRHGVEFSDTGALPAPAPAASDPAGVAGAVSSHAVPAANNVRAAE